MRIRLGELRRIIRELIQEDMKNIGSRHQKTVAGTAALRKMHDAPGVLDALSNIDDPKELAQVLQATIDAVPITKRDAVLKALGTVGRHERTTHKR